MQQFRVRRNRIQARVQLQLTTNLCTPRFQLRLNQLHHTANYLVQLHRLQLRLWHLREFAEPSDDPFQIRDLRQQRSRTLPEYFLELLWTLLPRAHQILHRKLKRKQWVLQLMRQPPRQFAPCRHALGLHQPFFLPQQLGGHSIERIGQLRQFIPAGYYYPCVPVSRGDFLRSLGQLLHWPRHPRRGPTAQQNGQYNSSTSHQERHRADMPL